LRWSAQQNSLSLNLRNAPIFLRQYRQSISS
jgi:hypothetical protein